MGASLYFIKAGTIAPIYPPLTSSIVYFRLQLRGTTKKCVKGLTIILCHANEIVQSTFLDGTSLRANYSQPKIYDKIEATDTKCKCRVDSFSLHYRKRRGISTIRA